MVAHLINTSNRINADVAGQTRGKKDVAEGAPSTAGPTVAEAARTLFGGEMDSVLAGGSHPETIPAVADTSLQKATDSVRGVLGGLKPKATSVTAPGPSGGVNAAQAVQSGTKAITDAGTTTKNAALKIWGRIKPGPR